MGKIISTEVIHQKIFVVRGFRVILDSDLANLYSVTTKRLNEQVKRNLNRFPSDFMFQLNNQEVKSLRSHFATSNRGGRRYHPYVFTEHGAIMLANVLSSPAAIEVSIQVVRAFVELREILIPNTKLAHKLAELEKKMEKHDEEIFTIFEAIRQLMAPSEKKKSKIGFMRE